MIAGGAVRQRDLSAIEECQTQVAPGEDALVKSAQKGNQEAFGQLLQRNQQFCMGKAYAILRNHYDAEDEVQAACAKAWAHISSYHGHGTFSAWIGRIVTNQCLMRLRRSKLAPMTSLDESFGSENSSRETPYRLEAIDQRELPEDVFGNAELAGALAKEIHCMPPMLRHVLVMRDLRHMPIASISALLNVSIPAAKSRLVRARAELRLRVMKHFGATGHTALLRKPNLRAAAYVRGV
ncbi:MAG TPA: sigma-70 family RNA polymerase sigma factor [Bryobacteraceae bacterium]|nr:sigma-70 family RNA polymerase sigma factor [Bryobacteraceae bacterium]